MEIFKHYTHFTHQTQLLQSAHIYTHTLEPRFCHSLSLSSTQASVSERESLLALSLAGHSAKQFDCPAHLSISIAILLSSCLSVGLPLCQSVLNLFCALAHEMRISHFASRTLALPEKLLIWFDVWPRRRTSAQLKPKLTLTHCLRATHSSMFQSPEVSLNCNANYFLCQVFVEPEMCSGSFLLTYNYRRYYLVFVCQGYFTYTIY